MGIPTQLKPQLPLYSAAGRHIQPDLGMDLRPTAEGADRVNGMVSRGHTVTTLVEVRVQSRGGSTDLKNEATIRNYAHCSDNYGLGSLLVHVLCPHAVGQTFIDQLELFAHQHLVGFLPVFGLTYEAILAEMEDLTERRAELARTHVADALAALHSPEQLAAALRASERNQYAQL